MPTITELSHIHRFEPATEPGRPPLLLLHGTGGDESDLLPLGRMIAPGAALLAPRGQVLENGAPRFFRRLREGVFDEADVVRRAHALADFVTEARAAYGLAAPVALGFSNGANIAAALSYFLGLLSGAVFFAIENDSRFVKFHAFQSMLLSVAAIVVWIVYMVVMTVLTRIPFLGFLVAILGLLGWAALMLGFLGLWLYCMFRAFQGERFKLPYLGEVAEKQVWPTERA